MLPHVKSWRYSQGYEIKQQVTGFERRVAQTETPNNVGHWCVLLIF